MQKIGALDGRPCVASPSRLLHLSPLVVRVPSSANLTRIQSRVRSDTTDGSGATMRG